MAAPVERHPPDPLRPPGAKLRVLFVGATPTDTARLAVGEEYRHVDASVRASDNAARFEFHFAHEVRADELGPALLRHRPHVVHFSGHGSAAGELLLPDATGQAAPARPEQLAKLFAVVGPELSIRCVVLNACYSEALARALAAHVDCVIGVPTALKDRVAVAFAGALYQAIGFGRDLDAAYRYACAQVELTVPTRGALPTLHCREGVSAADIRFLQAARSTVTRPTGAGALRPAPASAVAPRWQAVALATVAASASAAAVLGVALHQPRPASPRALDAAVRAGADAAPPAADAAAPPDVTELVFRGELSARGRPLRDAAVAVAGADCRATTDARGVFELRCAGALPSPPEATVAVGGRPSAPFRLHASARYSVDRRGRVTTHAEGVEGRASASAGRPVATPAATRDVVTAAPVSPPPPPPAPPCPMGDPRCDEIRR
ncbi:MAG: CHAT domain-containing protein [Polyangiales bacterium]